MAGLRLRLAHKEWRFPSVYPYRWRERNWISQQNLRQPECRAKWWLLTSLFAV